MFFGLIYIVNFLILSICSSWYPPSLVNSVYFFSRNMLADREYKTKIVSTELFPKQTLMLQLMQLLIIIISIWSYSFTVLSG